MHVSEVNARSDRTLKRVLLGILIAVLCIVWAFVFWRLEAARTQWFDRIAQIDAKGVDVVASISGIHCKSFGEMRVAYRWRFEDKQYEGLGSPCKDACRSLYQGEAVTLRFIPARPTMFACSKGDSRRQSEAPSRFDALLPLTLVTLFIFLKLFDVYRDDRAPT